MFFSCLDSDFLAQYFKIDCTFSETHPITTALENP